MHIKSITKVKEHLFLTKTPKNFLFYKSKFGGFTVSRYLSLFTEAMEIPKLISICKKIVCIITYYERDTRRNLGRGNNITI